MKIRTSAINFGQNNEDQFNNKMKKVMNRVVTCNVLLLRIPLVTMIINDGVTFCIKFCQPCELEKFLSDHTCVKQYSSFP